MLAHTYYQVWHVLYEHAFCKHEHNWFYDSALLSGMHFLIRWDTQISTNCINIIRSFQVERLMDSQVQFCMKMIIINNLSNEDSDFQLTPK